MDLLVNRLLSGVLVRYAPLAVSRRVRSPVGLDTWFDRRARTLEGALRVLSRRRARQGSLWAWWPQPERESACTGARLWR